MADVTERLKLYLTPASTDKTFLSWRTEMSGETDSNMVKLDEVIAVLQDAMAGKQEALTFDDTPAADSRNPVTSAGIKSYVDAAVAGKDIGVSTFNGRTGAVTPAAGDYTCEMVGADPAGSAAAVQSGLDTHVGDAVSHITALERTAWSGKAEVPPYIPVTLTAAGWADNRQTVSAPGVSADELSQLLIPVAAGTAMEAYEDAVVRCRVQAENSLTFTCEEVPAVDLTVYIVIITLA